MNLARIIPFLLLLIAAQAQAQRYSPSAKKDLQSREDSLKVFARDIVMGRDAATRFRADSQFTRMLVRALKVPHSFDFPFDSLQTVSRLYSPDSVFRVFTWQVVADETKFRRHGAIQMRTTDGSLLLYPLIDRGALIQSPYDTITSPDYWFGSIYYKMVMKEHQGKKYYTLLGYDEHSVRSTKKRLEVLSFDERRRPVFGGVFSFEEDTLRKPAVARYDIEFKKDGNARLQWDEELDLIIVDHLISETNEPGKKYTYIPDGDYEGFKWKDGRWVHVEKVFTFKLKDGEAPVIAPVEEEKIPAPGSKPAKKKKG